MSDEENKQGLLLKEYIRKVNVELKVQFEEVIMNHYISNNLDS